MKNTQGAVALCILGAILLLMPALATAGPINPGEPVGTHIFCGKSKFVGSSLGSAQPLRAHGTCEEIISISDTRANITIIGDGGITTNGANGGQACNDNQTTIIGSDPSASEIIQVRGRNITIPGVEIRAKSVVIFPAGTVNVQVAKLIDDGTDFDSAQCKTSTGTKTGQDTNCNNSRGIRVQRGGTLLVGRNVAVGAFKEPHDPTNYLEQSGVCIHEVSKAGIEATQGSVLRVVNSDIHNVGGDGILVSETSAATIGFSSGGEVNLPTDPFKSPGRSGPNHIHNNSGAGITGDRNASVRIVGNYIHHNTNDGIRIRRTSFADIAANLINANSSNGIRADENAGVNLGTTFNASCLASSFGHCPGNTFNISGLANSTTLNNSAFGLRCSIGAYITGLATKGQDGTSPITGLSGAKTFGGGVATTGDQCIDKTS